MDSSLLKFTRQWIQWTLVISTVTLHTIDVVIIFIIVYGHWPDSKNTNCWWLDFKLKYFFLQWVKEWQGCDLLFLLLLIFSWKLCFLVSRLLRWQILALLDSKIKGEWWQQRPEHTDGWHLRLVLIKFDITILFLSFWFLKYCG